MLPFGERWNCESEYMVQSLSHTQNAASTIWCASKMVYRLDVCVCVCAVEIIIVLIYRWIFLITLLDIHSHRLWAGVSGMHREFVHTYLHGEVETTWHRRFMSSMCSTSEHNARVWSSIYGWFCHEHRARAHTLHTECHQRDHRNTLFFIEIFSAQHCPLYNTNITNYYYYYYFVIGLLCFMYSFSYIFSFFFFFFSFSHISILHNARVSFTWLWLNSNSTSTQTPPDTVVSP